MVSSVEGAIAPANWPYQTSYILKYIGQRQSKGKKCLVLELLWNWICSSQIAVRIVYVWYRCVSGCFGLSCLPGFNLCLLFAIKIELIKKKNGGILSQLFKFLIRLIKWGSPNHMTSHKIYLFDQSNGRQKFV